MREKNDKVASPPPIPSGLQIKTFFCSLLLAAANSNIYLSSRHLIIPPIKKIYI